MPEVVSGEGWSISQDKQGLHRLGLRGPWSDSQKRALQEQPWQRVSLQAVEWEDYTPLLPFKSRLQRLSVFDGPAGVKGLDELIDLTDLDLLQARLSAVPRLERLERLAWLEIYWKKGISAQVFSLPNLQHLLVASLALDDLRSAANPSAVTWLEFREGSLKTLAGLQAFEALDHLCLANIRALGDVSALESCKALSYLEIDGCPKLEDVSVVAGARSLRTLKLGSLKRAAPFLSSAWFEGLVHLEELLVDVETRSLQLDHLIALRQLRLAALRLPADVALDARTVETRLQEAGRREVQVQLNRFKTHSLLVVRASP
jgi:hypothetical protein